MSEHTADIVEHTEVLFKRVKAAVSERLGSGPLCWAIAGPDEVHRAREMAETILNNWHNDQHQLEQHQNLHVHDQLEQQSQKDQTSHHQHHP